MLEPPFEKLVLSLMTLPSGGPSPLGDPPLWGTLPSGGPSPLELKPPSPKEKAYLPQWVFTDYTRTECDQLKNLNLLKDSSAICTSLV